MKNSETNEKTDLEVMPKTPTQKGINIHKKAASHFEAAAKSHLEAAKHHETGDHDKAAKSTIEAHGHSNRANKAQKNDLKFHTTEA